MKRPILRVLGLLLVCALLTGCQSAETPGAVQVTLPPAAVKHTAPTGDAAQAYEQTVMLYLPSLDGTRLIAVPKRMSLPAGAPMTETMARALLTEPAGSNTAVLGSGVELSLAAGEAVEVSGQVATVSLAPSALALTYEQLFTVGQALANTLCQFGDVQYVNLLIQGVQPGMGPGVQPAGCYQANTREELSALWARAAASQGRRTYTAALYFPAPSGKGILCEPRTLAFSGADLPSMALMLLDALSTEAALLPRAPRCPDFRPLLAEAPSVDESSGQRRLVLKFQEGLNRTLIDAGITRSVMMASLTYTMITFLPHLDALEVSIGSERISSLSPSGVYGRSGEIISFEEGALKRSDFSGFLLAECGLYLADGEGQLKQVFRPVPFRDAYDPRKLVEQLLLGPQPFDSVPGLSPTLPEDLRDSDLLGAAYDGDVLVLNFSGRLPELCRDLSAPAEERLVYSLVNTLCGLPGVKRAAIFVEGKQPESLSGSIYLPGDFLPLPEK